MGGRAVSGGSANPRIKKEKENIIEKKLRTKWKKIGSWEKWKERKEWSAFNWERKSWKGKLNQKVKKIKENYDCEILERNEKIRSLKKRGKREEGKDQSVFNQERKRYKGEIIRKPRKYRKIQLQKNLERNEERG